MLDVLKRKDKSSPDPKESQDSPRSVAAPSVTQTRAGGGSDRSYQNDLRAIGRHADDAQYRQLGVYEVNDGFVVRALVDSDPHAIEAIEVPDTDLKGLILKNFTARGRKEGETSNPLCPTGYEDFLRALGHELEASQARSIAIQEMVSAFAVTYRQLDQTPDGYVWESKEWLLDESQVQEMLDAGFSRREAADK